MRQNEVTTESALAVGGYGLGYFRIGGIAYDAPLVVLPKGVTTWGGMSDADTIVAAAAEIDIIVLGTGPEIAHIPAVFRERLQGAGIGVEFMASVQACRTFNVLLGEGRRVGLALLPI